MARRTYQAGYVFQKGKRKSDRWDPTAPAYGRYWADAPGAMKRHGLLCLGVCRTRTIAERNCVLQLEKLGVNSTQTFIEATCSITFRQQGEMWLRSLGQRKRNPLEQTTIDNRRYALDTWLYPLVGDCLLADFNNRQMKELVERMTEKLAPASIRDYRNIAKAVIASAINDDGEPIFPRKWNEEYIDAPIIRNQRQPSVDQEAVERIISASNGQTQMLYALLAGCGPLRVGEALGLDIRDISSDLRTLRIHQKAKRGLIQPFLKTQAGEREVDLCAELSALLRDHIGNRTTGLLFHTASGRQKLQTTILRDSLHPILRRLGLPMGGFNIFRRFRITHLEKSACPESLRHFWSGHAQKHVSERYIKLLTDRAFRLGWAERVGLGFSISGQPGQLIEFRKAV